MSSFANDRQGKLDLEERILLLFPESAWAQLNEATAPSGRDQPAAEILLDLLTKQVWAYCEEKSVFLVTRAITLDGKIVQLARGDYGFQVENVQKTSQSFVTKAFRLGLKLESDWEIVTPRRSLPFPTTRGALQLLEAVIFDDEERPEIEPADALWTEAQICSGKQAEMPDSSTEISEIRKGQDLSSPCSEEKNESAPGGELPGLDLDSPRETTESFGNASSENGFVAEISAASESSEQIRDAAMFETRESPTATANAEEEDRQRLIDLWISQLADSRQSGPDSSVETWEEPSHPTDKTGFGGFLNKTSERFPPAAGEPGLLPENREFPVGCPSPAVSPEQNNKAGSLAEEFLSFIMENAPENRTAENSAVNLVPDENARIQPASISRQTLFRDESAGPEETTAVSPESPVNDGIKQPEVPETVAGTSTKRAGVFPPKEPLIFFLDARTSEESGETGDGCFRATENREAPGIVQLKAFDPDACGSATFPEENARPEQKPLLNRTGSILSQLEEGKLQTAKIPKISSFLSTWSETALARLKEWEDDPSIDRDWSHIPELVPLRLIWFFPDFQQAESCFEKVVSRGKTRCVLFRDDAVLSNREGKNSEKYREIWMERYRRARIASESESTRLRRLRNNLEQVEKSFQEYVGYQEQLLRLSAPERDQSPAFSDGSRRAARLTRELITQLAKLASLEERLRKKIETSGNITFLIKPDFLKLQKKYMQTLQLAADKERKISNFGFRVKTGSSAAADPAKEKTRRHLTEQITAIDRFINETFGGYFKNDSLWSYFAEKDIFGLTQSLSFRERILELKLKSLSNWQRLMETNPSILEPQIWVGTCENVDLFQSHDYYPHIIVSSLGNEGKAFTESLAASAWLVAKLDPGGDWIVEPGGTLPPEDPQILYGILAERGEDRDLARIIWEESELLTDRGVGHDCQPLD